MQQDVKREDIQKELYKFAFGFYKDPQYNNINKETAIAVWEMFFPQSKCKFIGVWCEFIEKEKASVVTKDLWNSFWELNDDTKGDFKNFVDDGCWPS